MSTHEIHGEILAFHQSSKALMQLSSEERIFAYYMFRAGIPFNYIFREQNHTQTNTIIDAMKRIRIQADRMKAYTLKQEAETYLVYMWANHGFYFRNEQSDNKRTPDRLKLRRLNRDLTDYIDEKDIIDDISDPDQDREMIGDSIETSGNNFYSKEFTEEMYESLPLEVKASINAYFEVKNGNPIVRFRCVNGKNGAELQVVVYWLCLALHHVILHHDTNINGRKIFDVHFAPALSFLIQFLITGDERYFKLHCIEWIQTNSIIDWTMGFIETYNDPKKIRGNAGAEITIKDMDMSRLNESLLNLEQKLPISYKFKRNLDPSESLNSSTLTPSINVSINTSLYGAGDYGPGYMIAAYCLPNYDEIRSKYGSKQIIYQESMSTGEIINPELYKQVKTRKEQEANFDTNKLYKTIWNVQVIAHETVGHASGRFSTTKDGVQVTDLNYNTFITEDTDALEELRAEINALYLSVFHIDELDAMGLYNTQNGSWVEKLGHIELAKWCIIEMCRHGVRQYRSQKNNFTEIVGAHERANLVLTNYLIAAGAIKDVVEPLTLEGNSYYLTSIEVLDLNKATIAIVDLLKKVQTIKSTGDGSACKELFSQFTKFPITIETGNRYRNYQIELQKALVGPILMTAQIYSRYTPVIQDDKLVDIAIDDDENFISQNLRLDSLMHSTKLE